MDRDLPDRGGGGVCFAPLSYLPVNGVFALLCVMGLLPCGPTQAPPALPHVSVDGCQSGVVIYYIPVVGAYQTRVLGHSERAVVSLWPCPSL